MTVVCLLDAPGTMGGSDAASCTSGVANVSDCGFHLPSCCAWVQLQRYHVSGRGVYVLESQCQCALPLHRLLSSAECVTRLVMGGQNQAGLFQTH